MILEIYPLLLAKSADAFSIVSKVLIIIFKKSLLFGIYISGCIIDSFFDKSKNELKTSG